MRAYALLKKHKQLHETCRYLNHCSLGLLFQPLVYICYLYRHCDQLTFKIDVCNFCNTLVIYKLFNHHICL